MYDLSTSEEFISKFWSEINEASSILITSHKNPDDDSFSSVISMMSIVKDAYPQKKIDALYTGTFRNRWSSFEYATDIKSVDDISQYLHDYDVVIVLDVAKYDRFCDNAEVFTSYKGKTICIDHHSSEHDNFDLLFLHTTGTSTAELLYKLFCERKQSIRPALCESLLLGILGDTAWFGVNMAPDHSYILTIAERLMREGNVDLELFKSRFRGYSESVFYVIQELIRNASFAQIAEWPRFMYSYISRDFISQKGLTELDLKEGCDIFVGNYGKTLNDVLWGFITYPSSNGDVKVSLRSRPGGVNVRVWAEQMGIGGGHNGASGMKFSANGEGLDPVKQLDVLFDWMRNNEPPAYELEA